MAQMANNAQESREIRLIRPQIINEIKIDIAQ